MTGPTATTVTPVGADRKGVYSVGRDDPAPYAGWPATVRVPVVARRVVVVGQPVSEEVQESKGILE